MDNPFEPKSENIPLAVYKDIAHPAAKEIGEFIKKIVSIITHPVGVGADILNNNLTKFIKKIEKVPKSEAVLFKPYIAIPIMQQMMLVEDETLSDCYAELLKKSFLKSEQNHILPNYSRILSSLSPEEVHLLDFLYNNKFITDVPFSNLSEPIPDNLAISEKVKNSNIPMSIQGIPFLEVRRTIKGSSDYSILNSRFIDYKKIDFLEKNLINIYIDNLKSLGLFDEKVNRWFRSKELYASLEDLAKLQYKDSDITFTKGQIKLTQLAKSFMLACTQKKSVSVKS